MNRTPRIRPGRGKDRTAKALHDCQQRGNTIGGLRRNLELCQRWIRGETGTQLAAAYGITRSRVYQILAMWDCCLRFHTEFQR